MSSLPFPKKCFYFSIPKSWLRQFVTDVREYYSCSESDHILLVAKQTTPTNKIAGFHSHKPEKATWYKIQALKNDSALVEFCPIDVSKSWLKQHRGIK